jgi:hypothetical protein
MNEVTIKLGKELKVGDVIKVWWNPGWNKITMLHPMRSLLPEMKDARAASFELFPTGMTIEPGMAFEVRE